MKMSKKVLAVAMFGSLIFSGLGNEAVAKETPKGFLADKPVTFSYGGNAVNNQKIAYYSKSGVKKIMVVKSGKLHNKNGKLISKTDVKLEAGSYASVRNGLLYIRTAKGALISCNGKFKLFYKKDKFGAYSKYTVKFKNGKVTHITLKSKAYE